MKIYLLIAMIATSAFSFNYTVSGNKKTEASVIHNELKDLEILELTASTIKEIERRLWNLRLFSKVELKVNKQKLNIKVEDRWTLIPIAKLSSGGGSTYYTIGAYDINFLGTNSELGAQYENLNGSNAGVVWLRKPQLLGNRNLTIGFDLWSIKRVRNLYKENGEDDGAFTLKRNRFNSFIENRWNKDYYSIGLQVDHHQDQVSEDDLTVDQMSINAQNLFSPKQKSSNTWFSLYGTIGRLNYKNYLVSGSQIFVKGSLINSSVDDNVNYHYNIKYNYYHLFKDKRNSNFALQLSITDTNLNLEQYQNYIGGLSEVRGYQDGQFYDQSSVQLNIEQRLDIFESSNFVTQAAVFTDMAQVDSEIGQVLKSTNTALISSGLGLRFISPKIFRFVARLDYAQTFSRYKNKGISFGVQQFF